MLIAVTMPAPVTRAWAVALGFVPAALLMVTLGGVAEVYPLPGSVIVMPVMTPFTPTVAWAVACRPSAAGGSIVTTTSGSVNGLKAQFVFGPK